MISANGLSLLSCTVQKANEMMNCSIVLAYPENDTHGDIPYLFRSYQSGLSPFDPAMTAHLRQLESGISAQDVTLPLAAVARCTSAAPRYFKPMEVYTGGLKKLRFKDGGFGSNNPSLEAYHDILDQHGGLDKHMGPFVSIGTGISKFTLFSKREGHLRDIRGTIWAAFKFPSLTASTHRYMQKQSNRNAKQNFPYFRFDGGDDLGKVNLDEWEKPGWTSYLKPKSEFSRAKTLEKIRKAVNEYLECPEINEQLRNCAELLVRRRRLRQRDVAAWQRYAVGTFWVCDHASCTDAGWKERSPANHLGSVPRPKKVTRFNLVDKFEDHMCKTHGMISGDQEIKNKVDECRWCSWMYPLN